MKNEMTNLIIALNALGIAHTINYQQYYGGVPQVVFSDTLDVICHDGSMGGRDGLLELWNQQTGDCIGYLTALDVVKYVLENN